MSNPEPTLHNRTVLISTGSPSAPLVRALCEQLTSQHRHYRTTTVALVSNRVPEVGHRFADSVQFFACDFSKREQVVQLIASMRKGKLDPSLDLVIQLDSEEEIEGDLVDRTSSELLGFVNLLTNFVPLLAKNAAGGRIVSIRSSSNNSRSRAFRESQTEYSDLVRTILNSEEASKTTVQLSTIFCDRLHGHQSQEMAQQIIQTIESARFSAEIKLNPGRNSFEFCSSNLLQLAFGLDKLQLRKARKGSLKVQ